MPKACSLAMKPSLRPQDPSGITFHATRAPCKDVNRVRMHYCGCDVQLQSVITVSEEGEAPRDSDRHALAWEALYVPSTRDGADPNQAPTEAAPSIPDVEQGETPSTS